MLARLRVASFALVAHVDIELGDGLTVVTGETGAGKSILIGALNSILGGPISADLVRGGAARCEVEGLFELDDDEAARRRLEEAGFELDDDAHFILRREIRAEGRSRAFVNGAMVPVRRLREAGQLLVDLHGQHEHQSLLDPERHSLFLDECSGLGRESASTAAAPGRWMDAVGGLHRLQGERQRLRDEEELRRYQLEEIRRLAPEVDEDERLEREIAVLANQETLEHTAAGLYESLYGGDDSIVDRLGQARRELESLIEFDPSLAARVEALASQINPHFLFNTLTSISSLIRSQPETARMLIVKLSALLRRLLRSREHFVTLREELASIDEYLDIETVRFGPTLGVKKLIAPETLDQMVPSMLLQPLVENCVKHGLSRKVGGGTITISSQRAEGHTVIEVIDDGQGMVTDGPQSGETGGIGLRNVDERLQVIYGANYHLKLSSAPGAGTCARIEIPELVDLRPASA